MENGQRAARGGDLRSLNPTFNILQVKDTSENNELNVLSKLLTS